MLSADNTSGIENVDIIILTIKPYEVDVVLRNFAGS
jgi:hypothetical protein